MLVKYGLINLQLIAKFVDDLTNFCFTGNLLNVLTLQKRFTFQAILNAQFSVDSFFFLRFVVKNINNNVNKRCRGFFRLMYS